MDWPKYPKLNKQEVCAFPEREQCNYTDKQERCPYMKYNNSKSINDPTRWECKYVKTDSKDKRFTQDPSVKDGSNV